MSYKFLSVSSNQTQVLGRHLANKILSQGPRRTATVIALQGELGSGKTTFLRGLAKGVGIKEKVLSPTFVILKKFQITNSKSQIPKFQTFYHFDCYRLESARELYELGWKGIVKDPQNLIVVEWAERLRNAIPKDATWLRFQWRGESKREIRIKRP